MGRLTPLQSPWEGLQVTNFDQCLHIIMVIGKHIHIQGDVFGLRRGVEGRGYAEELSVEEFVMGEENFHEGGAGFFSIF